MSDEPTRRVARIDRHELADMPARWADPQRGRYLRRLLRARGIDTDRLYQVEYYPLRRCWLLTQVSGAGGPGRPRGPATTDAVFYLRARETLRRAARTACAALAAHSAHFAHFGCKYQLPAKPEAVTPATLADSLGGPGPGRAPVRFDGEGGWQASPSDN
jgi:hypothetical protein